MTQKQLYFGHGKLLLTSEYFVMDGALALALPTKLGQQMEVELTSYNGASLLKWKAINADGKVWFEAQFSPQKYHVIETTDKKIAIDLQTILRAVRSSSNDFIPENKVTSVVTELDFSTEWGLGSSSTLIYMIAKWAAMNPFHLLKETFGGSGYDIACAGEENPIVYQLVNKEPHWESVAFSPAFKDQLYFVYLGKKQNSRRGIKHYKATVNNPQKYTHLFTDITKAVCGADNLDDFERALNEHEHLIAKILKFKRCQDDYFSDYQGGVIKSLGAWGGDFALATSTLTPKETTAYFNSKGLDVVLPYKKLIV